MNLKEAIHDVIETTSLTDPADVSEKVLSSLSGDELVDALRVTLPQYVRYTFSQDRMLNPPAPAKAQTSRSSKVAAVRNDWQQRLNTPLFVNGEYRRLGDLTAPELRDYADTLRVQAQRYQSKADYYEQIAAALPDGATASTLKSDPTETRAAA